MNNSKTYHVRLEDGRKYIFKATPLKGEDGGRGLHPSGNGYVEITMISPEGKSHPFAVGAKPQYLTVKRGLDINPQHAWFMHGIIQDILELPNEKVLNDLAAKIVKQGY